MNKRSLRRKKKRKLKKERAREFRQADRMGDEETLIRLKSQMTQDEVEAALRCKRYE